MFFFLTMKQHTTFKESMINRLSNLIYHNRSAAKISQVLCSSTLWPKNYGGGPKKQNKNFNKNHAVVWHFLVLFLTLLFRTEHWSCVFTRIDKLFWVEKFKVLTNSTVDKMIHTSNTLSNILPSSPFFYGYFTLLRDWWVLQGDWCGVKRYPQVCRETLPLTTHCLRLPETHTSSVNTHSGIKCSNAESKR